MNPASRYYAYLQRKCLEADKYSSLNAMWGQILPWLGASLALMLLTFWLVPGGGPVSDAMWVTALIIWFVGIGFVTTAFFQAARKRRKMNTNSSVGDQ